MKQVRIYGREEPIEVEDVSDLIDKIAMVAKEDFGLAMFCVNDATGEIGANLTLDAIREHYDEIEYLAIKPYNEAA